MINFRKSKPTFYVILGRMLLLNHSYQPHHKHRFSQSFLSRSFGKISSSKAVVAFFKSVATWDGGYILARPRSMEGGDLHHLWKPYGAYAKVDLCYSMRGYQSNDIFPVVQNVGAVLENVLNFVTIYYSYNNDPLAILLAYTVTAFTFWKTVLFLLVEVCSGFANTGHNKWYPWITMYALPNGIWIIVPLYLLLTLGRQIAQKLNPSSKKYQYNWPTIRLALWI